MKRSGRILVDEEWRRVLDSVAEQRKWPSSRDSTRLAESVRRVSDAYNREGHDAAADLDRRDALAARALFFFPRDIAKGWGAARELARAGLLGASPEPLRVLDLGAGLGAMTWGIARALADERDSPNARSIEAVLIDADADALKAAEQIAELRKKVDDVSVEIRATRQIAPFSASLVGGPFDLVIAGQLLSELDRDATPEDRLARHVRLVRSWLDAVESDGALVLVEPALRDRTRHLHAIRDAIALDGAATTIFAPCLHAESCPALVRDEDWCAEDVAVDLPEWLAAIARGAGLRWQGATFSYLVLRKDERSLASFAKSRDARFRVVSDRIATKGKTEFFLCGAMRHAENETVGRIRVTRLDRHETSGNEAWNAIARGSLVAIDPPPSLREGRENEARIDASSRVEEIDVRELAIRMRGG